MCGILGYWSLDGESVETIDWFDESLRRLERRGPDFQNQVNLENNTLRLGHTRLAIIDVSAQSNQPLSIAGGSYWITYNGEVYNYRSLRKRLENLGCKFQTESDTEVVLFAYEKWGEKCLDELDGIFSFAIWSKESRSLFVARDHLGVKPLYFSFIQGKYFAFASQLSALLPIPKIGKEICRKALRDYLSFGYVPEPRCIVEGCKKLPPGSWLRVSNNSVAQRRYWKPQYNPNKAVGGDVLKNAEETLCKSIKSQMVSDVPVGALLSGGIDSTFVASVAAKSYTNPADFTTFTLGFDVPASDERRFALEASEAIGTRHKSTSLTKNEFAQQLQVCVEAYDEPFDFNGPLPMTRLAALVREHSIKVVLAGDGGDELFAGYLRYDAFVKHKTTLFHRLINSCKSPSQIALADASEYFRYEGACDDKTLRMIVENDQESDEWFREPIESLASFFQQGLPPVVACQLLDLSHYLPGHILTKVDRATMFHGVEARVPFLSRSTVEMALQTPTDYIYQRHERKALLKSVASRHIPKSLTTGRKKGFSSPLRNWIDDRFIRMGTETIANGFLVAKGLIRSDCIAKLKASGHQRFMRVFWLLYTAELWFQHWIAGTDTWRQSISRLCEV